LRTTSRKDGEFLWSKAIEELSSSWGTKNKASKCVTRKRATIKHMKFMFFNICTSVRTPGFRVWEHMTRFMALVE
jgi:hypothetical protein